ncbi:hypothetical protein PHYSODRAFT_487100 [Phytophthora sojae]|uniref:DDE-1 domain-containing protein n=1 Tax=Phytophthora sojae (strain P6497) TaxID=1094619 RepID=G4YUX6_PHYSP|nr:hypothetical protein PHYSODRAFT_487100 [Phytophthora sojae]EGZ23142.1 hypothetical protein PHYSODRAFT_487100 [Phytophthora sojae]|eukprot:XP_009518430.1 hypothetical protein PHYSODRAFT_487100 [Phytophthora sojae]
MLIFKNPNSSHPIQGLPDSVDGVCYRSTPSAFINNVTMEEWLHDVRCCCWGPGGPFAGDRILWMDNASGHSSPEPADRFPIQRIKAHWRSICEARNMQAIRDGDWATNSKALSNPGKQFFLETAAECIRRVNLEVDNAGLNWAKKSMLECGLDVPADGVWKLVESYVSSWRLT